MPTDPLSPLTALPGVADAAATARAAVDRLAAHRVLRRQASAVAGEAALRGAHASAVLEGSRARRSDLSRPTSPSDPLAAGALRVATELPDLLPVWRRAPGQALARLHALAARDLLDDDALGRPATAALGGRVEQLVDVLAAAGATPAVVVGAVAHGELVSSRAFGPGSGLVARAVEALVLAERGVDRTGAVLPAVGHLELGNERYAVSVAGFATGGPDGVAAWLRHCAEAVTLAARDATAVCEALQRGVLRVGGG